MALSKSFALGAMDVSSGTVLTTGTFDSTGFTHLCVFVKHEGATTTITPSDNKGSTGWLSGTKQDNNAHTSWGQMQYVKIGTPGAGHTVTITLGAARDFRTIVVWLIGSGGTIVQDAESVAFTVADNTAIDAGSLVTSGASVVSFMGVAENAGVIYTPGSGWTEDFDPNGPNFTYGQSRGPEITTPIDPVCTCSANQGWAACAISFREVVGAGGPPPGKVKTDPTVLDDSTHDDGFVAPTLLGPAAWFDHEYADIDKWMDEDFFDAGGGGGGPVLRKLSLLTMGMGR